MALALHDFTPTTPHPLQVEMRFDADYVALKAFMLLNGRQPKMAEKWEIQKLAWTLNDTAMYESYDAVIRHTAYGTHIEIRGYMTSNYHVEAATCWNASPNRDGVRFYWES